MLKEQFVRFKTFITECKRVFKVTKKPSMVEFKTIVKISGIGIAIIGFLGFMIQIIWRLAKP
ncbi:protein translocase SEC61 complex subunit gamma [archaeon]|nr:protein translocase SEC61 complex subunit gamma [archaeon]|tara:strand:- start:280 stop:465 length:186 start_codon:yes stop_codon:yes gene_type:complete